MKLQWESHQGKRVSVGSDGCHCITKLDIEAGVNSRASNDKLIKSDINSKDLAD